MISQLVYLPDIPNTQKLCILNSEIFFFGIVTPDVKSLMYRYQVRNKPKINVGKKEEKQCLKKSKNTNLRLVTSDS